MFDWASRSLLLLSRCGRSIQLSIEATIFSHRRANTAGGTTSFTHHSVWLAKTIKVNAKETTPTKIIDERRESIMLTNLEVHMMNLGRRGRIAFRLALRVFWAT